MGQAECIVLKSWRDQPTHYTFCFDEMPGNKVLVYFSGIACTQLAVHYTCL